MNVPSKVDTICEVFDEELSMSIVEQNDESLISMKQHQSLWNVLMMKSL